MDLGIGHLSSWFGGWRQVDVDARGSLDGKELGVLGFGLNWCCTEWLEWCGQTGMS